MAKGQRYVPVDFGSAPASEPVITHAATPSFEERGVGVSTVTPAPAEEPSPVYTRSAPKRGNKALWAVAPLALALGAGAFFLANSGPDEAGERETGTAPAAEVASADGAEEQLPADAATVPVEVAEAAPAPLPETTPLPTPVVQQTAARPAPRVEARRTATRPAPTTVAAPAAEDASADVSATVDAADAAPAPAAVVPSTPSATATPAPAATSPLVVDTPPLVVEPASEPAPVAPVTP